MANARLPGNQAIVIGSSGGIGAALSKALEADGFAVTGESRLHAEDPDLSIDVTSEDSIRAAADRLRDKAPFSHIFVATGLLHAVDLKPEKALREIDETNLARLFAVNTIGPALIAKHFVPLLPRRGRSVFAALSARVGSISDNRLGGWCGYRASKAALNMIVKTAAIELRRTHPEALCVALHPGTVHTRLSQPFQGAISPENIVSPDQAARHLLEIVASLTPSESGKIFAWDGAEIDP